MAGDFDSTIVKKHRELLIELVEDEDYKPAQDILQGFVHHDIR
jgi:hypothetical protein